MTQREMQGKKRQKLKWDLIQALAAIAGGTIIYLSIGFAAMVGISLLIYAYHIEGATL
jgi:hypothetical protein